MAKTRFTPVLRRLLLALAGLALSAGLANAAIIHLSYDPAFGGSFAGLGFNGDAEITVPDSCLAFTGDISANQGAGSCNPVVFTEATVNLYNLGPPPSPTIDALDFMSSTVPNPIFAFVVNVVLDDNMVVGLDTTVFGSQPAAPIPVVLPNGGNVWLQFVSNFSRDEDGIHVDPLAFIYIGDNCNQRDNSCAKSNGAPVTFSLVSPETVPEPGSIILVLTAVAAMGWLLRRRIRVLS